MGRSPTRRIFRYLRWPIVPDVVTHPDLEHRKTISLRLNERALGRPAVSFHPITGDDRARPIRPVLTVHEHGRGPVLDEFEHPRDLRIGRRAESAHRRGDVVHPECANF